MTGARLVAVALSSVTLGVVGCGGSSGGSGGAAAKNITIAGTLDAGSVTSALTGGSSALSVSSPLALAGYKLYCVTFNTPPVSGTATADATGSVSLTLAAQGVPFGCFILDAQDKAVATLMFTSGSQNGQTLTSSADANLGTSRSTRPPGSRRRGFLPAGRSARPLRLPRPVPSVPGPRCRPTWRPAAPAAGARPRRPGSRSPARVPTR